MSFQTPLVFDYFDSFEECCSELILTFNFVFLLILAQFESKIFLLGANDCCQGQNGSRARPWGML